MQDKDWRRYCKPPMWHPAAAAFPIIDDAELAELAKDIKANGLLNPVVLLDDRVLDGRNRLLACDLADVEPQFLNWEAQNGVSPTAWVISQNLARRHLSPSQKAACAVELLPLLEAEAKQRQGTRSDIREKIPGSSGGRARDQAAKMFGVNPRYISDAKRLKEKAPDLFEKVRRGEEIMYRAKFKLRQQEMRVERQQAEAAQVGKVVRLFGPEAKEEIAAAEACVEDAQEKYAAVEHEYRKKLNPLGNALAKAKEELRRIKLKYTLGLTVRQCRRGEQYPPLTEQELQDYVLNPDVKSQGFSSWMPDANGPYGRGPEGWDALHILFPQNWILGERPSDEFCPWMAEFPVPEENEHEYRYHRRTFWFPCAFLVPDPEEMQQLIPQKHRSKESLFL